MYHHPNHRDNWLFNHTDSRHLRDCQDQFGIWAPGTNDTCWMNDAFNLYAMEVEKEREKNEDAEE